MSTQRRNQLREVMSLAWQFIKRNGYTMSEALRTAWANVKLRAAMGTRIVKFYFQKVDGSISTDIKVLIDMYIRGKFNKHVNEAYSAVEKELGI